MTAATSPPGVGTASPPVVTPWRRRSAHHYTVTAAVVLGMGAYFLLKRRSGPGFDFWEHAAAVDAFMRNPLDPSHPFLASDAPHPFLTPFHLLVALGGRVLFVAPTTALLLAGIGNLALVLFALKRFVDRLVGPGVATLVVVFTLFLWGDNPWFFSGFLHSGVAWYVLPYASTFAIGATLFALSLFLRYQDEGDESRVVVIALLGALVLLSHQAEALFLYAAMGTLAVARPSTKVTIGRQVLAMGIAGLGTLVVAFGWPFFSFRELVFDPALRGYRNAVSVGNVEMYQHVLRHIWLACLGVPFALWRLRRNWRDPVALLAVVAAALYGAGWVFNQYLLGRLVAAVVLMLHVALAAAVVDAWRAARTLGPPAAPLGRWLLVSVAALVLFGANLVRQGTAQAVPFATLLPASFVTADPTLEPLSDLEFLPEHLSSDDVVLADPLAGFAVPGMSGARIVATVRTFAWVGVAVSSAVSPFFDDATPDAERRSIAASVRATHVLVRTSARQEAPSLYSFAVRAGQVVHRDDRFVLVRLA